MLLPAVLMLIPPSLLLLLLGRLLLAPLLLPLLLLVLLLLLVVVPWADAGAGCQVAFSTAAMPRVALSRPCAASNDSSPSEAACVLPLLQTLPPLVLPLLLLLQQNAAQGNV